MSRIFITGSSDGLGQMAAQLLVEGGHQVVLHARNKERAVHAMAQVPGAQAVLSADLSSIEETKALAQKLNDAGHFDAVIHNAAVGFSEPRRVATIDGLPHVFAVNTLAPYILTALMHAPKRLVYISSSLHLSGDPSLGDLAWESRRWGGTQAYSDSKLHIVLLAFAVARHWPGVLSNCVEPGWVATKMGGPDATDDLDLAYRTQAWLAIGTSASHQVTGDYLYHQQSAQALRAAFDPALQDRLLQACAQLSGVALPSH
ncbi:SDR family NAD(P)-dependent oxidoreductase [Comamonas piscis]|uniref:SDR family NAD(P)-dependent oxidoreductase n=1 Tax=Comamonas piscis TaxID=1562974 RepID=A0A7G5EKW8_9BURK|nr:SDR family NAD(P)-dependent oxidoreductase [Comamonas piscis]QMV74643.1 SDR family NAD(P)-dependent oxidoreductase [Comamonas piscis]WSO33106.1 SDR family NAD(P)-dependent oxidoreductase [Comamonas piscis]